MIKYNSLGLLNKITGTNPLSVVRYGDGEAMILNGFKDISAVKLVMKRQLGFIPPLDDIEAIRQNLITAYKEADIIGIPINTRLHDKESYWYKAFGILNEAVGIENLSGKEYAGIDVFYEWLDEGHFDKLLTGIDTLVYISCRNLDEQFKSRYNIKNIYSFQIAPERKFTSYEGIAHYPDQFNQIKRWVTKVPVSGNVCLVGAGVIGKIYNSWLKDLGGTSIDIGAVFDMWAGRFTRGEGRGLDKTNIKYQL